MNEYVEREREDGEVYGTEPVTSLKFLDFGRSRSSTASVVIGPERDGAGEVELAMVENSWNYAERRNEQPGSRGLLAGE